MILALRILALIVVMPAVFVFVAVVPLPFLLSDVPDWLEMAVAAPCAIGIGWLLWIRTRDNSIGDNWFLAVLLGAFVTGGLGFALGFFGPMLLAPGANQGPLLGILITGPVGFVLGGIGGFVYWLRSRQDVETQ